MSVRIKYLLAALVALLWGGAMLAAFWWFEARYLRPFDSERAELFSGEYLALPGSLGGAGSVRVVHFWDPACPCNAGNQQHLAELIKRFGDRGVSFYALQKPGTHGRLPEQLAGLQALSTLPGSETLPASPAVGIWNKNGRLVYVGPYSEGAVCNSSNSFIEPILEAILAGRQVNATHSLAVGCFCDWKDRPPVDG
ncbi:thiol-disulfide isomerase [Stutzerimonas stutzeri]|uniref:Thiol-disulfide isomerase n=1 Tax=Stutzerimonas stutzeri TaxID=316 RepID=W8RZ86_STUST|nr:DUF6436 domain-containing protein [Stutzerimonas stutzeri]AHL77441.1 thiol-disulfide isomerase [Stutzerimonas stutzeri]MCQ4330339.1 DUF6436 domain-containing protein [Stutzerimonas stutzeri]